MDTGAVFTVAVENIFRKSVLTEARENFLIIHSFLEQPHCRTVPRDT